MKNLRYDPGPITFYLAWTPESIHQNGEHECQLHLKFQQMTTPLL